MKLMHCKPYGGYDYCKYFCCIFNVCSTFFLYLSVLYLFINCVFRSYFVFIFGMLEIVFCAIWTMFIFRLKKALSCHTLFRSLITFILNVHPPNLLLIYLYALNSNELKIAIVVTVVRMCVTSHWFRCSICYVNSPPQTMFLLNKIFLALFQ